MELLTPASGCSKMLPEPAEVLASIRSSRRRLVVHAWLIAPFVTALGRGYCLFSIAVRAEILGPNARVSELCSALSGARGVGREETLCR